MQTRRGWLLTAALLGLAVVGVRAQNPLDVAPDMYKKVFQNERVRVLEVTFQPGQKIPPHAHPDHFVYVLEAGKLRISKPDGTSMDADLQVGQVIWIPAEKHWAENIGDTVARLLVTELEEPASAAAAPAPAPAPAPPMP